MVRCVTRIESKLPVTKELFLRDIDAQDICILNFERSIRQMIDVMAILISTKGLDIPETMAGMIEAGHLQGWLNKN
ncbi:MAG: hypothetical protein D6767_05235 [Candidatus Hydrogenedentota bacterium]|nr:MAG: hypothetical protein D6767_05235 [Candidatus Hydrogenedentota bacterium]